MLAREKSENTFLFFIKVNKFWTEKSLQLRCSLKSIRSAGFWQNKKKLQAALSPLESPYDFVSFRWPRIRKWKFEPMMFLASPGVETIPVIKMKSRRIAIKPAHPRPQARERILSVERLIDQQYPHAAILRRISKIKSAETTRSTKLIRDELWNSSYVSRPMMMAPKWQLWVEYGRNMEGKRDLEE